MISTILVPLDGSLAAEAALGYAALLPSQRVRLLRVEPDRDELTLAGLPPETAWRPPPEPEVLADLDRAAEPLRKQGRLVETVLASGDPAAQILSNAADADLVVMTTHGRGAGSRALFGSVADRVTRHATAPTLIVRPEDRPSAPLITRIVVPLDGSPLAAEALGKAAEFAAQLGVPIHLVRVLDVDTLRGFVQAGVEAGAAYARAQEETRRQAVADLEVEARRLRARDLIVTADVSAGKPATELLDAIQPTDLVVMTTHGRRGIQRWLLGSVAEKLVREAAAPVLLIRVASPSGPE